MSSDINTISVTFTNGGSKTVNVVIPVGNYTCASVLVALSSVLITAAAISSGSYTGFTLVTNFSYNSSTATSTLAITNTGVSININFGANLNAGLFFGFSAATGNITSVNPVTSTQVCVANPVSYLLLRCSSLKQFNNREFLITQDTFSDVVYRIPISTNQGTWIQYYLPSEPVFVINNAITSFTFYLTTNLTATPINLQSLYYSFQFTLEELTRPPYESLLSARFVSSSFAEKDTELDQLVQQRDAELAKLDIYKKKLDKYKSVDEILADTKDVIGGKRSDVESSVSVASVF